MAELLLELVSEEIPAGMQAPAAAELKRRVLTALDEAGLEHGSAEALATPRRLALVVDGIPEAQPDLREERRGPRVDAPDKAIQGFLRAAGIKREDCEVRESGRGTFLFAMIERKGRPSDAVLAELMPAVIRDVPWPKSMRWGAGEARWVRPLHSILCLFAGQVVEFEFAGIAAGAESRGHRFHAPEPFVVANFADYVEKLAEAYVILDADKRRGMINSDAEALAGRERLKLIPDEALLDELAGLVEWPVALMGRMDERFLALPREVPIAAMRAHQRYLALSRADGSLAPAFIAVANLEAADGGAAVIAGNERVLTARLADAEYFWQTDLKRRLEDRLPALDDMVFHARLGSLGDKTKRIAALAGEVAAHVPGAEADHCRAAAMLAKADLTSGMVGEFPELQGLMGSYYAAEQGERPEVASAIAEHYAPQGPSDVCPTAPTSVAVALADKLDTLVGFFAIGETPTGSRDPFALRRAALGVIRIVLENGIRLPLIDVLFESYRLYLAHLDPVIDREQYKMDIAGLPIEAHNKELMSKKFYFSILNKDGLIDRYTEKQERELNKRILERIGLIINASVNDPLYEAARLQDLAKTPWKTLRQQYVTIPVKDEHGYDPDVAERQIGYINALRTLETEYFAASRNDLLAFFADRLKVHLREKGVRHDLIAAVFALGGEDDLVRLMARVEALAKFLASDDGGNLLTAYRRAANIVRIEEKRDGREYREVSRGRFKQPEEDELWQNLFAVQDAVRHSLSHEQFEIAMKMMASLRPHVDKFFEQVTVNAEQADVRANRLALLRAIVAVMDQVADFSQIEG